MPPLPGRPLQGSQNAADLLESGRFGKCNADVVELVDTLVLEASASAWEFESPHPHHAVPGRPLQACQCSSRDGFLAQQRP